MSRHFRRREVLQASAAIAAIQVLPSAVQASSANAMLRTAHIGVGGMGSSDLSSVSSHPKVEVAALCDVELARLKSAKARHPHAKEFRDFREMISSMGDKIDAVVVSTPDHTHAPAAMTALMNGKPVYCQKPLTHEVFEARQLRLVAESKKLPTQMGIEVHGVLWIIDELEYHGVGSREQLYEALRLFEQDDLVFLPQEEIRRRLRRLG